MIEGVFKATEYTVTHDGKTVSGNLADGLDESKFTVFPDAIKSEIDDILRGLGMHQKLWHKYDKAGMYSMSMDSQNFFPQDHYKMDGDKIFLVYKSGEVQNGKPVYTFKDDKLTLDTSHKGITYKLVLDNVNGVQIGKADEKKAEYEKEEVSHNDTAAEDKTTDNSGGSNTPTSTAGYAPTPTSGAGVGNSGTAGTANGAPTGGVQGIGNSETPTAAPTSDTSAGANTTPTDSTSAAVGGAVAAGVGAAAVEVVKAIFGGNGGSTGTATATPASNNAAGKPIIALDKKIYAPHDTVTVTTTGITEENFEYGVMLMVCEVGTDYIFNGNYEELSYGTSTVLFDGIIYCGNYEMRLYDSARTNVDDLTPLAVVPFKVVSE